MCVPACQNMHAEVRGPNNPSCLDRISCVCCCIGHLASLWASGDFLPYLRLTVGTLVRCVLPYLSLNGFWASELWASTCTASAPLLTHFPRHALMCYFIRSLVLILIMRVDVTMQVSSGASRGRSFSSLVIWSFRWLWATWNQLLSPRLWTTEPPRHTYFLIHIFDNFREV